METKETPKLVPSKGDLPLHPSLIQSVQGIPCGFAHRDSIVSTVSLLGPTRDQHFCTEIEESQIVLAILHQTVSYLDGIILTVVFTNVMRKLLI